MTSPWICFELLQWKISKPIICMAEDRHHVYFTNDDDLWKWNRGSDSFPVLLININSNMSGIAWDGQSKLYICCSKTHQILQYDINTEEKDWYGTENVSGWNDGELENATFDTPQEITIDSDGNIYITTINRIRKIVLKQLKVESVTAVMTFGLLSGICVSGQYDAIYVSDFGKHRICQLVGGLSSSIADVIRPAHAVWLPEGILVTSKADQRLTLIQHDSLQKDFEVLNLPIGKRFGCVVKGQNGILLLCGSTVFTVQPRWSIEKLIWIASLKEDTQQCAMACLPRDVVKELICFVNGKIPLRFGWTYV